MRTLSLLSITLLVAGCNQYTPQSRLSGIGYSDTQLAADTWRINFTGHNTTTVRAHSYALRRAAEVASNAGYRFFRILSADAASQTRNYAIANTNAYAGSMIAGSITQPEVALVIQGLREPLPGTISYECALILASKP